MPYLDYQSVIDEARKQNPNLSSRFPDDDGLYEYLYRRVNPKKWTGDPNAEFEPPENIYEARRESAEKAKIAERQDNNVGKTIVTDSPRGWAEASIAGALGDLFDSNYLRYSAMQGTADLSRMILTGKSGYQLKDKDGKVIAPEEYAENLNVFEEVGAWILGQFNAADGAIWGLSGGLGKVFTTAGTKAVGKKVVATQLSDTGASWFQKKWAKSSAQRFATSQRAKNTPYSNFMANWVEGAPASMASIGFFSAAAGTVHSAVNQRKTNDDGTSAYNPETGAYEGTVDLSKTVTDGLYEGAKGTMLGGMVAGVSPALSGPIGRATQKLQKSNSNFNQRLGQLMERFPKTTAGLPAGPIEGIIFGNLPYIIEGTPKDEQGNIDWDTVFHDTMHGTVTVWGLKSTMGLLGQGKVEWDKYRNNKKLDIDLKDNISSETVASVKKTLSETLPPLEVEKFIRNLTESEKIKVSRKGEKTSIEYEIDNFIDLAVNEAAKLKKIMEAPDFKLENLSREQKQNTITAYNTLQVVKEVLRERLSPEKGNSFIKATAEHYNKIKEAEAPLWKDLPKAEKQKFLNDSKKQLESFIKRVDKHFETVNENLYKPIHANKEAISTRKKELKKTVESLKGDKKIEAAELIKDIDKVAETKLSEIEQKVTEIKERKAPEQQIQSLKDELIGLTRSKRMTLPEWKQEIESRVVKGDTQATIENLKSLRDATKKSGEQTAEIIDKANQVDLKKINIDSKTPKGAIAKTKEGKTNNQLLKEANLSDTNKKMAVIGIEQFLKPRNLDSPGNVQKLFKFFEYLEKNRYNINEANTTIFSNFVMASKSKGGLDTQKAQVMKPYQDIVAAFYGGKAGGAKQVAFSDIYMDGKGVATTLRVPTVGKDRATIDTPEQVKLFDKIESYDKTVSNTNPREAKAAVELLYWFGRRSTDILQHLKVSDLNISKGTIRLSAARKQQGVRVYSEYPLKDVLPNLFNRLVKIAEGKNPNDILITNKAGKIINHNPIIKEIMKDLKINLFGEQKEFTVKSFRNTIETDASSTKLELFATELTGRGKTVQESYVKKDFIKQFKEFRDFRLGKKSVSKEVVGDISGTLEQQVKFWEQQVSSLKKSIKTENSPSILENLKSQLKGASMQLFGVKSKLKQERMTVEPGKPVGPEATRSEKSRFKEWSKNKYPELKVELDKRRLKGDKGERLPENVLETVAGLEVKVRQGAPIEAAVHGTIHPIIKTLRAIAKTNKNKKLGKEAAGLMREIERRITKTPEFKKWYKQYVKEGMKPAEARDRAIEEATAVKMGEIVSGRLVDKTFFNRMSDWAKRVYTNIKTYFKDVSQLKDNELFDLFGQKIYNRNLKEIPLMSFTQEVKGKMQFMTVKKDMAPDELVGIVKKQIDLYAKKYKLNKSSKEALTEQLLFEAEAGKDINMIGEREAYKIMNELQKVEYQGIIKNKDVIERLKVNSKIKEYRKNTDITSKQEKEWFKSEGETDIINAPLELLKDWKDIVYQSQDVKGGQSKLNYDVAGIINAKDVSPKMDSKTWNKIKTMASEGLVGFNRVVKGLGLDKLHKWVSTHLAAEQTHIGRINGFIARAEGRNYPMFSKARKQINKSWKAVEEVFGLLESSDKDGAFKRLNDPTVDKADKAKALTFIKKAFKVTTKKNKKTGKTEYYNEGINWNPNTKKGTLEGELMYAFKEGVMKHYVREFAAIVDIRFPKAGAKEQFIKDNGIEFLNKTKKGFYIPIRFSEAFGEFYSVESVQAAKKIKEVGRNYAIDMANKKYGDKYKKADTIEKTKMVNEFLELGTDRARMELLTSVDYGSGKVTVKNLISRNKFQFEQTLKGEDGALIKVFDNNFESLMMPYATGMSKLLANMEYAPWAVGLKGYTGTADVGAMLSQASSTLAVKGKFGKKIRRIIKDGMMERTGSSRDTDKMPMITGITREYTATLMRLQLGGVIPLTGVWNIMEQSKQMLFAYNTMDVAKSFVKAFNISERIATEDAGAVSSIGLLGYKPGQFNLLGKTVENRTGVSKKLRNASEWLFKKGGMPFSESVARTWARLASGMEMQRLVEHLKLLPESSKRYKYAVDRLKSFYELNNGDIAILKKYGFDPNPSLLKGNDVPIVKRTIKNAFRKGELVGNIKTAGTTVESMSAGWTNFKLVKPLLMYKKIAMSTSMNNGELMRYNLKHKHFLRTGLFLGGTYLKGVSRIAVMKYLFNQSLANVENTDWWTSFWATMYNGEFLGISSELLSPYKDTWFSWQDNLVNESAMMQNYKRTLTLLAVLAQSGGKKINADFINKYFGEQKMSVEDAGVQWLRSTVASYNQYYKIMNQKLNPYNANYKKIQVWNRDYNKKHSFKGRDDYEATEATMYFRNLRTVFNTGTKQEFHQELTLAYLGQVSNLLSRGYSEKKAMKEANAEIRRRLRDLSPIPYSVDPENGYKVTPFEGFFLPLDDKQKRVVAKTYMEYYKRVKDYQKSWQFFLRKQNIGDLMKNFDFKMDDKLLEAHLKKIQLMQSRLK